ncbi:MAG: hypothetical protein U0V70_12210, partial [Terriglobia bacterium]
CPKTTALARWNKEVSFIFRINLAAPGRELNSRKKFHAHPGPVLSAAPETDGLICFSSSFSLSAHHLFNV